MKFILINPPHPYLVSPDLRPPLGLLYFGSVLEQSNIDVEIINLSKNTVENTIIPKADVYGITTTSLDINTINLLSKKIKNLYYNSIIIVGGAGTFSKEYIDFSVIDSIVIGEIEHKIEELLFDINNKKIKQIYNFGICPNIDKYPFPARHLYDITLPINVLSSRGCAFNCSFCMSPLLYNHRVRFRNNDLVINELKYLIDKYNTKYFIFEDDMLTINKKRFIDLCEKISKLNITWRGMARVKPLDEEMVVAMKLSGCKEIALGIESFDDNVLEILNKGTTVEDNLNAIKLFSIHNIKLRILLMVRTPGQTKQTLKLNKKYILGLPENSIVACTNFTPIPGSDIWNNPNKYKISLFNKNINEYNYGFFNSDGILELIPIFSLNNRTLKEFHSETEDFHKWLLDKGIINKG